MEKYNISHEDTKTQRKYYNKKLRVSVPLWLE